MTFLSRALSLILTSTCWAADPTTTLWFERPATSFHESLPLGNGRIGAMVLGGLDEERIVLNESSVWSGSPEDADRPEAHTALPEIRRLLLEGRNVEAERLVNANFTCQGKGSGHANGLNIPYGCYQTLGNLRLKFTGRSGVSLGAWSWRDAAAAINPCWRISGRQQASTRSASVAVRGRLQAFVQALAPSDSRCMRATNSCQ